MPKLTLFSSILELGPGNGNIAKMSKKLLNESIGLKIRREIKLMEWVFWSVIVLLILLAFGGLIFPIIPGVALLFASFVLYGLFFSFEPFHPLFWIIQTLFVLLILFADYLANLYGVKKFGGSKAGVWGSTIGLLVGPFVIPVAGILLGPFIGAVAGELIVHRTDLKQAVKIGIGSVAGFIGSTIVKGFIQTIMVVYFLVIVL